MRILAGALAIVSVLAAAQIGHAQRSPAQKFDPVGRWRFLHTDGTPVRVIYTDGWDDLLTLRPDGHFSKRGWAPDADRCASASNDTAADRLSADPGPPL